MYEYNTNTYRGLHAGLSSIHENTMYRSSKYVMDAK